MPHVPGKLYAKLALELPLQGLDAVYDYEVPEQWREDICAGCRVVAPFGRGNTRKEGIVLALSNESVHSKTKPILQLLDREPIATGQDIQLAFWVRERFFAPFYAVLRAMLPAGVWLQAKTVCFVNDVGEEVVAEACQHEPQVLALWQWLKRQKKGANLSAVLAQQGGELAWESLRLKGFARVEEKRAPRLNDKTEVLVTLSPDFSVREYAGRMAHRASLQVALLELLQAEGPTLPWHELRYYTGATAATLRALEKLQAVNTHERESFRRPELELSSKTIETLTEAQQAVFERLVELHDRRQTGSGVRSRGALLHGVTGSGKTAVYIKLIEHTLAQGGGAMVLVPEIALTPQLVSQFTQQFGDRVAMLNSGMTLTQRYDEWKRVRSGQADVVVGTRSAVFAPMRKLSLIILDEEHEGSYKSDNMPRYHARDVAKYRAAQHNALLVLGSATPSIESMYAARTGKLTLLALPGRFNASALPAVTIADLRVDLENGLNGVVGNVLAQELRKNLENGEQSILFVNRRGRDRMHTCLQCGVSPQCPACSNALTYHSANNRLMCHYCGYSMPAQQSCHHCGGVMKSMGFGTQRVVEELQQMFPNQPIIRMDTDTTGGRGAHATLLAQFRDERVPFLVGTQMVTKGLDFENVTLVGVLAADSSLNTADFRAHERTFALITQVVGRAGRGQKPGRAVVQSFTPQNVILQASAAQDYDVFYQAELPLRQARNLPPFSEMLLLRLSGRENEAVHLAALALRDKLAIMFPALNIKGPAPASLFRHNFQYRYQLVLLGQFDRATRHGISEEMAALSKACKGVYVYADFMPNNI
ncbi:MAG: primosomal protein N' [Oscillospiraceae bacterium]|nr:primosomal protein N' [Oscillospiraceae bacterium]